MCKSTRTQTCKEGWTMVWGEGVDTSPSPQERRFMQPPGHDLKPYDVAAMEGNNDHSHQK